VPKEDPEAQEGKGKKYHDDRQ